MKYLCLACYNPEKFAAMALADVQALVNQCPAKDAELKATGKLVPAPAQRQAGHDRRALCRSERDGGGLLHH